MRCAACDQPITFGQRRAALIWADPGGNVCVAHRDCFAVYAEIAIYAFTEPAAGEEGP